MDELVFAVLLPSVWSVAMTVKLPLVLRETANRCVLEASAALGGNVAVASLAVMPATSVAVLTRFQLASTPLTVTLKESKEYCAVGAPTLPAAVPGAGVSPGARICNLAKAPAVTVTLVLVLADRTPATSVAVMVPVPALLKVK